MFKKLLSVFLVVMMLMTLAVGCTKPADQPVEPAEPAEPVEPVEPAEPAEPGIKLEADEDYLTWNIGAKPKTWDPTLNSAADGGHVIMNLFEGLLFDTDEGLVHAAAERYEISDDKLTYTFYIREDAKWSDGKDLTAQDFVYSWKRACNPLVASEYSFIVTPYIKGAEEYFNAYSEIKKPYIETIEAGLSDEVKNDEDKKAEAVKEGLAKPDVKEAMAEELSSYRENVAVRAIDEKTLQVELNMPTPYFLSLTTFYTYMPVREDIVETYGEGWEKNPETCISNGAFKLAEHQSGSHVLMVKNENYWNAEAVELEGVKGYMIIEQTTSLNAYESGDIAVLSDMPTDEMPRLLAEDPNFYIKPKIGTYYYMFNVDVPPFDDVRVRKAFAMAIDRKMIVEQVTKAGQIPAVAFMPAALTYSTKESVRPFEDGKPVEEYGLDPYAAKVEEARALLADAGYPNGEGFPEIKLLYNTSESHKKVAEAVQQMFKQNLGIEMGLQNEDWAVFQDSRREGNYTIARGGWLGDYNDPMTMLDLFTSWSGNNDLQWRDEHYHGAPWDTKLNPDAKPFNDAIRAAFETSGTERDAHIKKAEDTMMDNMVLMPIYFYTDHDIIDLTVVEGVHRTPLGHWTFKDAKLIK